MDITRAKEILSVLADGVNPVTGEVLPSEDSCNQPDVIRALHTLLAETSVKTKTQAPEKAGAKWTAEEDAALIAEYESQKSISQIAKTHGRSKGAISSRLIKLGKLESK